MKNKIQWKDVVGYEGLYKVSNDGQVMSCARVVQHPNNQFAKTQTYPDRIMKLKKNKHGYMEVKLSKNGHRRDWMVHRLVAFAFIDQVEGKPYIDHIDGNKANNTVKNLEWVSMAENNQRAYDTGLKARVHAGQFLKGVPLALQPNLRRE